MIVAIINQTVPVGTVPVAQFREAVDVVTAVSDFVNSYTPPLNPADWLGFDTGWVAYTNPPSGLAYQWVYDFGLLAVVEQLLPETDRLQALTLTEVIPGPKADPSGGTTPFNWEDMGFLSVNLNYWMLSTDKAQYRIWGQHMTAQTGVNTAQIRLSAGGVAYSNEIDLPDTGGAWQNFVVDTIGFTLPMGRVLFVVQTKLRNALTTVQLRAVSLALMVEKY